VTPESKIQVNWQDNSDDETGFTVQRRSPRADGSWSDSDWVNVVTLGPDATGHLDGTVAAGPVYQYRVRAFNATGTSAWAMSANVAIVTTAPNAPSGLAAQFAGDNGVQLTWTDESEDEMGFQVQRRKRNRDGTWPAAYTALADAGPNMETYADQSATTNGYYQYRVRAHNTVGLSNWVEVKVWVTHTAPTAPSDLVATSVNSGADVSLAWTDNSGNETGFTVQRRKRTGAGTWSAWTTIQTTGPNVSTYTDEDVPGDGEYQYQVNAFNSVGPSAWAGPASIWRLTSKPADPTDFAPTVAAANQVQLTWTDNATNNQGYLLQRRTRNVDSSWPTAFEEIAWIADPYADEYLDDTVETGREYQYRLRAYNAVGPSNWAYVRINVLAVATATVGAVNAQQLNSQYVSVVYSLSAAADVCIEVRNIAGRLIATIPCGVGSAGVNTATWNLRNSSGAPVPSGTYLCIVTAHSERGGQARAVRTLSVRR